MAGRRCPILILYQFLIWMIVTTHAYWMITYSTPMLTLGYFWLELRGALLDQFRLHVTGVFRLVLLLDIIIMKAVKIFEFTHLLRSSFFYRCVKGRLYFR